MFIFGKNIDAGVQGANVNLSNLTNDNQLQGVQHDYRQVFASLLQDWLGASNGVLVETMFEGYTKVPVVDGAAVVTPDCYLPQTVGVFDVAGRSKPLTVFPNPASITAEVTFESEAAFDARLTLHSLGGGLVTALNVRAEPGFNTFYLEVASLPAAPYFVRLENKNTGAANVAKLSVAR
jgi:hypothetical protein